MKKLKNKFIILIFFSLGIINCSKIPPQNKDYNEKKILKDYKEQKDLLNILEKKIEAHKKRQENLLKKIQERN